MEPVLNVTLQGMRHDALRLEHTAANLANALTPGYKRDVVAASLATGTASFAELIAAHGAAGTNDRADVPAQILMDQRVGTLRPTGTSLDLALANTGFFEVQTDTGPAYTRQGTFQVDGRGRLVTAQGQPVMGHGGEIVLTTPQPTIDGEGNVFENDRIVGRLKVTRFADNRALQRMGSGLVSAATATPTVVDSGVGLRQGFLENSNVSTMQEMVGLMQTMRHFETMQRLAQGYDEMLSSAVRKLGDA